MKDLIINNSQYDIDTILSPTVNFSAKTGVCTISGESFMENSIEFYAPILKWLKVFFKTKKEIHFILKLTYYNTSSSKILYGIFLSIKDYMDAGNKASVEWHCPPHDAELAEDIEDFAEDTEIDIKIVDLH